MHGECRPVLRETSTESDDPRHILRLRWLAYTSEDRFIHKVWINPRLREQRAHSSATEFHGIETGQSGPRAAERCADTGDEVEVLFHLRIWVEEFLQSPEIRPVAEGG